MRDRLDAVLLRPISRPHQIPDDAALDPDRRPDRQAIEADRKPRRGGVGGVGSDVDTFVEQALAELVAAAFASEKAAALVGGARAEMSHQIPDQLPDAAP